MRHGKKFNHLGRQAPHRKAMLANMACSLIEHKKINTTVAKAKALQKYVEPLITKSKTDSTHSRRVVFSYLKDKYAVTTLFRDVSAKISDRPGGYTRILKTGFRLGDNAQMCLIELVDYNENMLKETKTKKSSRRRRGGAKKSDDTKTVTAKTTKKDVVEVSEADTKAEVMEEKPAVADAVKTTPKVEDKKVETKKVETKKAEEKKTEAKKTEEPKVDNSDKDDKKEV